MRNVGNKKNQINIGKRALPITLAALLSLQGCSGGGSGGGNSEVIVNDNQADTVSQLKNTLTGYVKAGPIVGANVSLKTLNGNILATVMTDNKGMYTFDTAYLLRQLSNNGLTNTSPLVLESENGIDVDPDDDGDIYNTVQKQVLGKVRAILDVENLDGSLVNPISTLVTDTILGDGGKNINLYKKTDGSFDSVKIHERIQQLVKELGIGDVNQDGETDGKDALSYDMELHKGEIRDKMLEKGGFIETNIHDGRPTDTLQLEYLQKVNLIKTYSKRLSDSHGEITLELSDADGYIFYSADGKSWINYFSPITIYTGQSVYYKEVYSVGKGESIVKQIDFSDLPLWNNINTETTTPNTGNNIPDNGSYVPDIEGGYQEPVLVLENDLNPISYTPITFSSTQSIETLKSELASLENQLSSVQSTVASVESQKKSAEVQIETLSNSLSTQVNSLPAPIKVLANADSSETQKNNAVTTYLGSTVNDVTLGISFLSGLTATQTITPIHISNPNIEISRLSSKISQFQTELNSLEIAKNTAYAKYQAKYQEYLTAKQAYDQSKSDAIYWKNQYESLKTQVTNKEIEYRMANNNEDTALANYNSYVLPNSSNYPISTGTSSYTNPTNVSQLSFSYRGYTVSATFNVQSNGRFPGTLKVTIQGNTTNYTINSAIHLSAMLNILPQEKKAWIDKSYYHNEVIRIGNELTALRQKKDEAYEKAFSEVLIAIVDQSIYQSAKSDYDTALASYNIANTNFQTKKSKATQASTQLTNLGVTHSSLIQYTNTSTQLDLQITTARNEESRLMTLVSQKEQTVTSVESEVNNKILASLGKIILNNWSPGTLWVSINLELYPNSTMEYKNGYSGGVFKNRNGMLIQTNEIMTNQSEYNNFPFTLKVKFNRVGNGNDFPALVWAEYKESSNSNTVYSTERYIANNKNDIATLFAKLTPLIKERINLMQHGYGDTIKNKILTDGNVSESVQYISTLSHNKVIDYLTNVQRSSEQYMRGFGNGTIQATQETYDMVVAGTAGTIHGLSEYGATVIDSFVYWEAKIAYSLTGDSTYQSVQRTVSNNIMSQGAQVVDELNDLDDEMKKMKDDIVKALGLINMSVENPEYWGGYINGYLSVLATESAAITVTSKSAGVAINALKASSGYIKLQKLIAKINVAGEIYKTTFKRVDLDILSDIMDPLEGALGERGKIVFPRLFSLADKYDINPKTYVHIVNGEWNDNGTLRGGLHHMKEVEELLRDGKIQVALPSAREYESISYTEYVRLDDTTKANIQVKGVKDSKRWSDIRNSLKTLFPSTWSEEDIAILIQKAEDNIRTILLDGYHLPLRGEPNKFWKFQAINDRLIQDGEDIAHTFTVNGKPLRIKLGGQYNSNGDLDFTITTLYP